MATMPIYGKNLKKSSSQEPKVRRPCWYAASGSQVLPSLFKWCPWVDLDLFCDKVKFGPYAFVWENGKTMDFSEIILVCDIKIGRCRQLN